MVFKCFIRFVLAQAAVTHGMELMTALFKVAQGMISTIMTASGLSALTDTTLPSEMVTIIEDVGFLESIPRPMIRPRRSGPGSRHGKLFPPGRAVLVLDGLKAAGLGYPLGSG